MSRCPSHSKAFNLHTGDSTLWLDAFSTMGCGLLMGHETNLVVMTSVTRQNGMEETRKVVTHYIRLRYFFNGNFISDTDVCIALNTGFLDLLSSKNLPSPVLHFRDHSYNHTSYWSLLRRIHLLNELFPLYKHYPSYSAISLISYLSLSLLWNPNVLLLNIPTWTDLLAQGIGIFLRGELL